MTADSKSEQAAWEERTILGPLSGKRRCFLPSADWPPCFDFASLSTTSQPSGAGFSLAQTSIPNQSRPENLSYSAQAAATEFVSEGIKGISPRKDPGLGNHPKGRCLPLVTLGNCHFTLLAPVELIV